MPFLIAFLSTIVMLASLAVNAWGHEVRPAVADIELGAATATITIEINAEAVLAGIDLGAVENTDDADGADTYDTLRALPPEALEDRLRQFWPQLAGEITLLADGARLQPQLAGVNVAAIGDVELLRDTRLDVTASLPEGTRSVQFGWARQLGAIALRQTGAGEGAYSGYLANGQLSPEIPVGGGRVQTSWWQTFADYIVIGFQHIIPKGLDHILFVLGLFFLSQRFMPLLLQVTTFTLAHTVTLALATLGIVSIPASIVEPLIAASIVYVAIENIYSRGISRWRLPIIFAFGLLHGLGFASVLGDVGLDPQRLITGLIGFNIGVELGQLAVIALAFLAVGAWFGSKNWYRQAIAIPASIFIACVGGYWFVERVFL